MRHLMPDSIHLCFDGYHYISECVWSCRLVCLYLCKREKGEKKGRVKERQSKREHTASEHAQLEYIFTGFP